MRNGIIALFMGLLLASSGAFAKTIQRTGDWEVDDSNPGTDQGTCTAATAGYLNRTIIELNVVVDKAGVRPLEVFLRPQNGSVSGLMAFSTSIENKIYYFAKVNSTGPDLYWNVPNDTATLIETMKHSAQMNFQVAQGADGELPLSMSGATASINLLQTACGAHSLLANAEFESLLLTSDMNRLKIAGMTPTIAAALRDAVANGVTAYRQILNVRQLIVALEAQFAALNAEQTELQTALNQLQNHDLPALTTARNAAQAQIDTANANLTALQANLTARQADLVAANAAYAAAYAALSPFIPEFTRLRNIVLAAAQQLASAQAQLAAAQQGINQQQQILANLDNEERSLNDAQVNVSAQLQQARAVQAQADYNLNNFNVEYEINRRTSSDGRLNQLNNEITQLQYQINQQSQTVNQLAYQRNYAANVLRQCEGGNSPASAQLSEMSLDTKSFSSLQAMMSAPTENNTALFEGGLSSSLMAPGGRPGGPGGHPGGPGPGQPHPGPVQPQPHPGPVQPQPHPGPVQPQPHPGPVQPQPHPGPVQPQPHPGPVQPQPHPGPAQRDCSYQRNAYYQAEAQLNQAQQALSQMQSAMFMKQNYRNQIMNEIRNDVYRQRDDLARYAAAAAAQVANLNNSLNGIYARLNAIRTNDRPQAQASLQAYTAQASQATALVASTQATLDQAQAALQKYKTSVNYDALNAEVVRTQAVVDGLNAQIATIKNNIAANQKIVQDQTVLRDQLNQQLAALNALITQKQTRLTAVQAELQTYNTQKAALQVQLDAAMKAMAAVAQHFAGLLPQ